jgi:hypothetical protein
VSENAFSTFQLSVVALFGATLVGFNVTCTGAVAADPLIFQITPQ